MREAIFPVFGPILIFAAVLPLSALIAKLVIVFVDRAAPQSAWQVRYEARYFLVVMASAAPLVWLVSASMHQSEEGRTTSVCVIDHRSDDGFCPETPFFAAALLLTSAAFSARRFVRVRRKQAPARSEGSEHARMRLASLINASVGLRPLRGRCQVDDTSDVQMATIGVWRPRVVVQSAFMERLDDEALVGALHHELEHVRGRDPLRYAVAGWALSVNPWGRFLLEHELDEWLLGRELYCDREAVRKGASAPAIAHAIVTAARPMAPPPMAALGTTSFEALKLRVQVLLAYAEQPPQPSRKQPGFAAAVLAMIALALLPHAGATGVLDAVHVIAERTLMLVSN